MSNVDEIKQRIDIVDLVSQYVTLKRAGKGYTARCPFHTEKTPSFHVDPSRQSWHCFGACGTGGDIFGFVMKKENCDFREALRILAERAGIALEARRNVQEDARRGRLYDVNEAAALYFQNAFKESDSAAGAGAAVARAYLEERSVAQESVDAFQLGYAPNSWSALTDYLQARGFTTQELVLAGAAIEGDRGVYDRFRHRLMFPIRDERGRVAGFGGRLLPGDAIGAGGGNTQPKYVNTSQSPIFDKGSMLYALDRARDAIRNEGQAVIVEGYMDVIAAHEHGYTNVVASMGTALTERQVGLLKRHTRNLVLALDADAAGSEATLRGVQVVADAVDRETQPQVNWRGVVRMQESIAADIRVLTMPEGRDPDDVIRGDPEQWPQLVNAAKPVLDYLFDATAQRHDMASPRGRSAMASELLPLIAAVSDRVVQSHYLQQLGRIARVDEASLRQDMRVPQRRAAPREAPEEPPALSGQANGQRDRKEEFCLALLFKYPELRSEGAGIEPDLFARSENRALFETWIDWSNEGETFEQALTPDLRPQYERVVKIELPSYDDDALVNALRSTVWGIEQQRLRYAKHASAAMLADLTADDSDSVAERARIAWQTGGAVEQHTAGDEADPAAAFVEDMEAGLKVHQRLLDQRRNTGHPAR